MVLNRDLLEVWNVLGRSLLAQKEDAAWGHTINNTASWGKTFLSCGRKICDKKKNARKGKTYKFCHFLNTLSFRYYVKMQNIYPMSVVSFVSAIYKKCPFFIVPRPTLPKNDRGRVWGCWRGYFKSAVIQESENEGEFGQEGFIPSDLLRGHVGATRSDGTVCQPRKPREEMGWSRSCMCFPDTRPWRGQCEGRLLGGL